MLAVEELISETLFKILQLLQFWYFYSVSAIVLVFRLLFSFCNLLSASAIWYLCSVSIIILVFRLLFSFCNLVFAFSFCKFFWSDILSSAFAKSGISTFLQLLQFGIFVLSLQLFWYFIFSSVSVILFGVIFCLPFLQNLVF